ncbi:hypothetical protein O3G_MSEX014841, partial [Manduca sexta]
PIAFFSNFINNRTFNIEEIKSSYGFTTRKRNPQSSFGSPRIRWLLTTITWWYSIFGTAYKNIYLLK